MNVEVGGNRCYGCLVKKQTDTRLRSRRVTVTAIGGATHDQCCRAGTDALVGKRGQHLGIAIKVGDAQLLKRRAAQGSDADRHILQILRALRCRYDDLIQDRLGCTDLR